MGEKQPIALVVDDDRSLRALCRINLEVDGFTVREAGSVAAAAAAVADERPDIVLLDVHLGNEQSGELLRELRSQGIPVAVVSGSSDTSEWHDQADAVLAKPFDPEVLVTLARRLAKVAG